jgi:hypothetical protein
MGWFSRWIDRIREKRDARVFTPAGILHKAAANLEPGVLTAEGFLGHDSRPLARILRDDALQFEELELDWDRVAERLEHLLVEGSRGLGEPVTVEGTYLVQVAETRGRFACPWEDGFFLKRSATVRRLGDDQTTEAAPLLYSDLSLHLLKDHHFLQGKGSVFRLEPEALKTVLGGLK